MTANNDLDQLLRNGPIVVNIGALQFADSVRGQDAEVVHVEWTPPAGGDPELAQLLDDLM
jgi:FdrA protein